MNDIDDLIKKMMNENVDERVGPRRAAPRVDFATLTARQDRRRRPPYLLPLAVAAAVAAVLVGTVGGAHLLSEKHHEAPATRIPTATVSPTSTPSTTATVVVPPPVSHARTSPATRPASSGTGSSHVSTSPSTHTSSAARSTTVLLGGASIHLPAGWHAASQGAGGSIAQSWCLSPGPISTSTPCPVDLVRYVTPSGRPQDGFDLDDQGVVGNAPQYPCATGSTASTTEQFGTRTLAGHTAEWRRFAHRCPGGATSYAEQYVVPSLSSWGLLSADADPATSDAMATIAANSTIPDRTASERVMDRGIITVMSGPGYHFVVKLERVVKLEQGTGVGYAKEYPGTVQYVIPSKLFGSSRNLSPGDRIYVITDGSHVVAWAKDYPPS